MKNIAWLVWAALALLPLQLVAQSDGCIQSLQYDVEVQKFYELPNLEDIPNLTELDKVKLRKTVERKHVEICLQAEGETSLETILLNPEEVYENWMTKVTRTVVNKDGVKMYNSTGELVSNEQRSTSSLVIYNENKAEASQNGIGKMPAFLPLTSEQIQWMQGEGMVVQLFDAGAKITFEDHETTYDFQNKFIKIKNFEEGELKSTVLRKYKTNTIGVAVEPDIFITKTRKVLFGGVCANYIHVEKYSNYSRMVNTREGDPEINENTVASQFNIFPNPVTQSLKIQIPSSENQPDADVRITDSFGTIVMSFSKLKPGATIEVPTSTWASGMYFLRVNLNGKSVGKRFFKH